MFERVKAFFRIFRRQSPAYHVPRPKVRWTRKNPSPTGIYYGPDNIVKARGLTCTRCGKELPAITPEPDRKWHNVRCTHCGYKQGFESQLVRPTPGPEEDKKHVYQPLIKRGVYVDGRLVNLPVAEALVAEGEKKGRRPDVEDR